MANPFDIAMPGDESGLELPEEVLEAGGEEQDPAQIMNDRLQEVISAINELEQSAQEYGIYNDRASMSALLALKEDAQSIFENWAGGQEEPMIPPEHQPGKVISQGPASNGPFGMPSLPPDELRQTNPFGGQIIRMR